MDVAQPNQMVQFPDPFGDVVDSGLDRTYTGVTGSGVIIARDENDLTPRGRSDLEKASVMTVSNLVRRFVRTSIFQQDVPRDGDLKPLVVEDELFDTFEQIREYLPAHLSVAPDDASVFKMPEGALIQPESRIYQRRRLALLTNYMLQSLVTVESKLPVFQTMSQSITDTYRYWPGGGQQYVHEELTSVSDGRQRLGPIAKEDSTWLLHHMRSSSFRERMKFPRQR